MAGLGGAVGSALRYLLTIAVQGRSGAGFPAGTLAVNVTGALLLGLIMRYSVQSVAITPEMRLLLATSGIMGFGASSRAHSGRLLETARVIMYCPDVPADQPQPSAAVDIAGGIADEPPRGDIG